MDHRPQLPARLRHPGEHAQAEFELSPAARTVERRRLRVDELDLGAVDPLASAAGAQSIETLVVHHATHIGGEQAPPFEAAGGERPEQVDQDLLLDVLDLGSEPEAVRPDGAAHPPPNLGERALFTRQDPGDETLVGRRGRRCGRGRDLAQGYPRTLLASRPTCLPKAPRWREHHKLSTPEAEVRAGAPWTSHLRPRSGARPRFRCCAPPAFALY